jgi:hypothetical protein
MKQTAVEWLVANIDWQLLRNTKTHYKMIVEKAKEMEKEQIINTWNTRAKIDGILTFTDNRTAEQYYNETFKSE